MAKMIVNSPSGEQQVIEIGVGGEYFDQSLVVWDERKDGKIPEDVEIEAGKMLKDGNNIVKSDELIPDHKTWIEAKPKEVDPVDLNKLTLKQLIELLKEKGVI